MKSDMKQFAWETLMAGPWAFLLSCGINVQQNGYREHSNFMMFWGVFMIAGAMAGFSLHKRQV